MKKTLASPQDILTKIVWVVRWVMRWVMGWWWDGGGMGGIVRWKAGGEMGEMCCRLMGVASCVYGRQMEV